MFFKPTNIEIEIIKVNNLDHGGAISFGSTQKIGRNVAAKKSQGYGQQFADDTIRIVNTHYVLDDDVIDEPVNKTNK